MVKNGLLAAVKEHVETEMKTLVENGYCDYEVTLGKNRVVKIMRFVPRHCSPNGEYEAPWDGNIEGLNMYVLNKYDLSYEEHERMVATAIAIAHEYITHVTHVFSEKYGCNVQYATYTDCSKEEFQQAINAIFDAPGFQRKIVEHPGSYHETIDTTLEE